MSAEHSTPEEAITQYIAALKAYTKAEFRAQHSGTCQDRRVADLRLGNVKHALQRVFSTHAGSP